MKSTVVHERQVIDPKQIEIDSIKNLIGETLENIENLEKENKQYKEMIENVLLNDSTYQNHLLSAKEATRVKSNTKKEIFKRVDVKHVVLKKLEKRDELKGEKEMLAVYLGDYYDLTGQDTFEDKKGNKKQILKNYRVVQLPLL